MRDEDPNFSFYKENCKKTSIILANALEFWTKSWQFYWISGKESEWKQKWWFFRKMKKKRWSKWWSKWKNNEKGSRNLHFLFFFGGCQNFHLNLHFFIIFFSCSFESSFFYHFFLVVHLNFVFFFIFFVSPLGCSFLSILNCCLHQFWMKSLSP